jgi:hypothetical protein
MASASRLGQRVAPGGSLVGALVGDLGRPSSGVLDVEDEGQHASAGESAPSLASFSDPDADGWLLQEITKRLAGR